MKENRDPSVHQRFSSRWGLLVSVLAISVGTGNIWRFPRIAAQSGGPEGAGAFLAAWFSLLFLWSIPLIVAEYTLGRKARMSPVGAFARLVGRRFTWMGAFIAWVTAAITFYYSVVVGWCIYYWIACTVWPLPETSEASMALWNRLQSGPHPLLLHALAMGLGAAVAWRGIRSIERANKFLMPVLALSLLASLVRALTLPGSWEGVAYLFAPEWSQLLSPRIWMEALTQNAWDTGAGWGLFLTYGAYMKKEHAVVRNAFLTAIGNNTVSLLAGLTVFGTAFAVLSQDLKMSQPEILEVLRTAGPASTGLTLVWLPQLFARMEFGGTLAFVFFLGLAVAGFTSLLAHLELQIRVLVDAGWRRSKAILTIATAGFLIGVPSALNVEFLGNQDFVWGLALMISGGFIAFAVLRHGAERLRKEEILAHESDMRLGKWWSAVMQYFIPAAAAGLLAWWLWLSAVAYAPGVWFNPLNPYSVMTCFVQWGAALAVLLLLNRRIAALTDS